MKAFSKEGLMRDQPMSADERRRMKSREWVQEICNKLNDGVSWMAAITIALLIDRSYCSHHLS